MFFLFLFLNWLFSAKYLFSTQKVPKVIRQLFVSFIFMYAVSLPFQDTKVSYKKQNWRCWFSLRSEQRLVIMFTQWKNIPPNKPAGLLSKK